VEVEIRPTGGGFFSSVFERPKEACSYKRHG